MVVGLRKAVPQEVNSLILGIRHLQALIGTKLSEMNSRGRTRYRDLLALVDG